MNRANANSLSHWVQNIPTPPSRGRRTIFANLGVLWFLDQLRIPVGDGWSSDLGSHQGFSPFSSSDARQSLVA